MKLNFIRVPQWIVLVLASVGHAFESRAEGTIGFGNSSLTRAVMYQGSWANAPQIVYGVFWRTNANWQDPMHLALPLVTNIGSGIIPGGLSYRLPGTEAGQRVFLQVRAWPASYGTNPPAVWLEWSGRTGVKEIQLGSVAGPGTAIWQSPLDNRLDRFYPLLINAPLTPPTLVTVGNLNGSGYTNLVDEGSQGTTDVTVAVQRRDTTGQGLNYVSRVLLTTKDGSALAGQDYSPTNVLVTFAAGETQKLVTIRLTADSFPESLEQFHVELVGTPDFIALYSFPYAVEIREARVSSVRAFGSYSEVQFPTTSSQRYSLEFSPDLTSWLPVPGAGSLQGSGGVLTVTDPAAVCCAPRFYRTRILP